LKKGEKRGVGDPKVSINSRKITPVSDQPKKRG